MVAQKLYEAGKITYMRTDSVNLSNDALDAAEKEISSINMVRNMLKEEFIQVKQKERKRRMRQFVLLT